MLRDGAIIFGDLIGKLDMLHVACDKCGRKGRYGYASRVLMIYGRKYRVSDTAYSRTPLNHQFSSRYRRSFHRPRNSAKLRFE
jgi:hypothetical protein